MRGTERGGRPEIPLHLPRDGTDGQLRAPAATSRGDRYCSLTRERDGGETMLTALKPMPRYAGVLCSDAVVVYFFNRMLIPVVDVVLRC